VFFSFFRILENRHGPNNTQSNIHISRKHTAVAGKVVFKEEKDTCDITDIIASILKGQVVMFQRCHFNFFELEKKL